MVDKFARKPMYLVCYALFAVAFAGYAVATTLTIFILLRIFHGFGFGISSVSGNTLVVDIMPPSRQGEGIGYFSMTTSVAMALGPYLGLALYGKLSFQVIFLCAFAIALLGWLTIVFIKPVKGPEVKNEPAVGHKKSVNDFILLKAFIPAVTFLLLGFAYGAISNYMGVYGEETPAVKSVSGLFFVVLAVGILLARLVSGRFLNRGKIVAVICFGAITMIVALILFKFHMSAWLFMVIALVFGLGYGVIAPAFQTMFINMAPEDHRGAANATFFTFMDLGIGLGIACAGAIIHALGFPWLFTCCLTLAVIGLGIFILYGARYYMRNKLK
ncbi:MAG: MFS transporter [Tannerellaceae bacterium]|nr:MFS transporter [Tannerellaceae bacterium]